MNNQTHTAQSTKATSSGTSPIEPTKSSEDLEAEKYALQATKIDAFMGRLRHAKSQGTSKLVVERHIIEHFCGADYDHPMFTMEGVEVYEAGKVPAHLQDELKSK